MDDNAQWNEEQEDNFDLRGILFKFLRHWYWFAIAGAIGFFVAREYLKRYIPIYKISAVMLIKDDWSSRGRGDDIVTQLDVGAKGKNLDNEMEILKSRPLIEKVVDNLELKVTYLHEGEDRDTEIYTESPIKIETTKILSGEPFFIQPLAGNRYEIRDQEKKKLRTFDYSQKVSSKYGQFRIFKRDSTADVGTTPVKVAFQNREGVVSELIGAIQVGLQNPNTTLVSLSMENALPEKGKDIIAKLLEEYSFTTLEDKNREATNTLRFIEERLKIVSSELGDVEQDVEQYRRVKGVTDLSEEANLFLNRVQDNDSKLNEIDINLKVLEGVDSYVKSNEVGNMAPAMLGVNDPVLTGYIDRLSELEAERTRLAQTVQPGNPYLETLNTQMRNVKQAIQENLRNQKSNLMVSKNSLQSMNNRLEGSISTIPRKEREFLGIKRQAGVKENLYLLLLQKREETALSYASTVTDSRVVEPPYASPGPIKPDRDKVYMYSLLVALLIPAALVFLKESLKNTVESKKEIEKKTGMKVFGEITKTPNNQDGRQIIDLSNRSFISEQLRMIRSNMQYLFTNIDQESAKTILITSSISGEGKSFVAINIAISLSLLDKKVVILGLDLRKPKVNEYLTVNNDVGISTYLIGQAQEKEIVKSTQFKNLFLVPSGPIPPNPSELISTARMAALVDSLKGKFDYIILDSPPVSLVTDAVLLAPMADATFYIVRHGKTPKLYLSTLAELIKIKRFKALSIIFNAVDYKNTPDYGYGYGYGYGRDGYYQDSQPDGLLGKGVSLVKRIRKQWERMLRK